MATGFYECTYFEKYRFVWLLYCVHRVLLVLIYLCVFVSVCLSCIFCLLSLSLYLISVLVILYSAVAVDGLCISVWKLVNLIEKFTNFWWVFISICLEWTTAISIIRNDKCTRDHVHRHQCRQNEAVAIAVAAVDQGKWILLIFPSQFPYLCFVFFKFGLNPLQSDPIRFVSRHFVTFSFIH